MPDIKLGLKPDLQNYTPSEGEIIYTVDDETIVFGNGKNIGGVRLATENDVSGITSQLEDVSYLRDKVTTFSSPTDVQYPSARLVSDSLDTKSDTDHSHLESDITDLDKYTQADTDTLLDTKENLSNKAINFSTVNDTLYPTVKAVNDKINTLATASHTHVEANITDLDKYTQAATNTLLATKENLTNKAIVFTTVNDTLYPTVKAVKDQLDTKSVTGHIHAESDITNLTSDLAAKEILSNKVTAFSSPTDTQYPTAKLVSDQLATKTNTGHTHVEANITDLDKYTQAATNTLLATKENLTNKVTSFSSPTDTQYPTAKLVKDQLDTKSTTGHTHVEANITDLDKYTQAATNTLLATKENLTNKAIVFTTVNDTLYPTVKAVKDQLDTKSATGHTHVESDITNLTSDLASKAPLASPSLTGSPTAPTATVGTNTTQLATTAFVKASIDTNLVGLLDYRGGFIPAASSGAIGFPTTGGSGTSGAVVKGDAFIASANGFVTTEAINSGDMIIANIDNPGQILTNWDMVQRNITYTPENITNKVTAFSSPTDTQYPTAKLVNDQLATKTNTGHTHVEANITDLDKYTQAATNTLLATKENLTNKVTAFSSPTDTQYPTAKLVKDQLDTKSATGHTHVEANITDLDKYTQAATNTLLSAKENLTNKVTSFSSPTDTQYPTAKLVSDQLSTKSTTGHTHVEDNITNLDKYTQAATDTLLATKENLTNRVSTFQTTPDNTHYPTEKLVKDQLDLKTNTGHTHVEANITNLDKYTQAATDTLLATKENLTNRVSTFQTTPDNTHYPTEKLVKDQLDLKTNTGHTHVEANITDLDKYTQAATNTLLATKENLTNKVTAFSSPTDTQYPTAKLVSDQLATKSVTGHIHAESDITNLTSDLALKASLASPALTGIPTAPTATVGTDTSQLATTAFVKSSIDTNLVGLLDYRGGFTPAASSGATGFPTTGGSGTSGAVVKGNAFIASINGFVTTEAINSGDMIIASIDLPGQILSNWNMIQRNITYTPENQANKVIAFSSPTDTQYPSAKLVNDQLATKSATGHTHVEANITDLDKYTQAATNTLLNTKENLTNKAIVFTTVNDTLYPTVKAVKDQLDTKSATGHTHVESDITNLTSDLAAKENTSNKVTAFSSPTDTQYPTAKLVSDQLATKSATGHTHVEANITNLDKYTQAATDTLLSAKENLSNRVSTFQTTPDNTHYPTEKLVKDQLDTKSVTGHTHVEANITDLDKYTQAATNTLLATKENLTNKVTSFSSPTDTQYPSAKLVKDQLDTKSVTSHTHVEANITDLDKYTQAATNTLLATKENLTNKVTAFSSPTDTQYPTAKLVSDQLATKSATGHTHVEANITNLDKYTQAATDTLLSAKENTINKVTIFSSPTDTQYPTAKLVKDQLDTKSVTGHTHVEANITDLDKYTQAATNTLLAAKENLSNRVSTFQTTPDNTHYPTEKLVKDQLDTKSATGHTHSESDVTNLISDLSLKAPLASPSLTGIPTAPTATIGTNTTQLATTAFVKATIDTNIAGLLDYRGGFTPAASSGAAGFPTTGGSGTAGAILKGDAFIASANGFVATESIQSGDMIISTIDSPGQTITNWDMIQRNITYTPENNSNKVTAFSSPTDIQYPSAKLVKDQLDTKTNTGHTHVEANITDLDKYTQAATNTLLATKENLTNKVTIFSSPTDTQYPTAKLVSDQLNTKSSTGHTHVEANITDLDKYTQAATNTLLAAKENISNKVTAFSSPTDTQYPSAKLVSDQLATKTNTGHTHVEANITNLDKYTQAETNTLLATKENLTNRVSTFQTTPDDTHYPTEKLVKDQLDLKTNTGHTHVEANITDLDKYTQAATDTLLSAKENTSNKVTAFQTTPDNTHYPTEKLLSDQLALKDDKTNKVIQILGYSGIKYPSTFALLNYIKNIIYARRATLVDITSEGTITTYIADSWHYTQVTFTSHIQTGRAFISHPSSGIGLLKIQYSDDGATWTNFATSGTEYWYNITSAAVVVSRYYRFCGQATDGSPLAVSSYRIEEYDLTATSEKLSNKVSTFQTTPDDTHYPTEKLVKDQLDTKSSTDHTHVEANITDLDKYTQSETDTLLSGKSNSIHTHDQSSITNLETVLTEKLVKSSNLSDIPDVNIARTNLGVEAVSNKSTNLTSPNDIKYPSVKAVVDYVDIVINAETFTQTLPTSTLTMAITKENIIHQTSGYTFASDRDYIAAFTGLISGRMYKVRVTDTESLLNAIRYNGLITPSGSDFYITDPGTTEKIFSFIAKSSTTGVVVSASDENTLEFINSGEIVDITADGVISTYIITPESTDWHCTQIVFPEIRRIEYAVIKAPTSASLAKIDYSDNGIFWTLDAFTFSENTRDGYYTIPISAKYWRFRGQDSILGSWLPLQISDYSLHAFEWHRERSTNKFRLRGVSGAGEDVANKVTIFNSPTDEQYPSAKLVSDQLDLKENMGHGHLEEDVFDLDKYTQAATNTLLAAKENLTNKAINFNTINDTLYPSIKAVNDRLNTNFQGAIVNDIQLDAVVTTSDNGTWYFTELAFATTRKFLAGTATIVNGSDACAVMVSYSTDGVSYTLLAGPTETIDFSQTIIARYWRYSGRNYSTSTSNPVTTYTLSAYDWEKDITANEFKLRGAIGILGDKESKSNKVTVFSSPTNTQYPSAKLVNDTITALNLASNTWTPTITGTGTVISAMYSRVLNVVNFSLRIHNTLDTIKFTLPVGSNFTNVYDLIGTVTCFGTTGSSTIVEADIALDRGSVYTVNTSTNALIVGQYMVK